MRLQLAIIVLVLGWTISGCGVVPRQAGAPAPQPVTTDTSTATEEESDATQKTPPAMAVSSLNEVKASLMQAYREWKGTPYQLGGSAKSGVDCSMLVNIVFEEYFGIDLPTNTKTQLNAGKNIRRAAIRTGDLVFFKTGRKTLHVGIAVNHGEFLHASTSNGVMISKLGNSYWRNRFLAARRVL